MTETRITAERLRQVLDYDPETGHFYWRVRLSSRGGPGQLAGTRTHRGYIHIRIDGINYQAHRLAWLYMTGEFPAHRIDHADRDGFNNRWSNLRAATNSQNAANTEIRANNTSGFKGVSFHKQRQRWRADIRRNGRKVFLGLFQAPEEAAAIYAAAAQAQFGQFAGGGAR